MSTAIPSNLPLEPVRHVGLAVADKICREKNEFPPGEALIKASLPKHYASDVEIHQMPPPRQNTPDLSKFPVIYDLLSTPKNIDMALPSQIGETERAAFERQLSTAATDLISNPDNEIDNDHRQLLIVFCKQAYLELHTELAIAKSYGGEAIDETILCAKSAVLHIATNLLSIARSNSLRGTDDVSIEARLLEQWSHESNIGHDILRMFVVTWNQIRNSLLKERLLEIAEIKQLAEKAVAALIKQGQEKFMQDTLSAWASIASAVVQLVPVGVYAAYARKTGGSTLHMNMDQSPSRAGTPLHDMKTMRRHAKAQELSNVLMVSRAFGEGVQGVINLFAARKGLDAAYAGADNTRYSNQMQAANIRLEYLNAQEGAAWQNILQMLSSRLELQKNLYEMNMRNMRV
jgi:hypothetical protein